MSRYRHHIFLCTNRRADGRPCCADHDAGDKRAWLKERCKALGISGSGGVRVNAAGCLDRCEQGPVAVVYPQGVWYSYVDEHDLEEIAQKHLVGGEVVERLKI